MRPLHDACRDGDVSRVVALLAAGADPCSTEPDPEHAFTDYPRDPDLETPLHWAAEGGHADVVKVLLEAGAPVDPQDDCQRTPLMMASLFGREAVVEVLLNAKANVNAVSQCSTGTALCFAARRGHLRVVVMLLRAGADHRLSEAKGWTALHFCALGGHWDVLRTLLEAGADPNARDVVGRVPLHEAFLAVEAEGVSLLLAAGADPDVRSKRGLTPMLAALAPGPRHLFALLAGGADPRISLRDGCDVLDLLMAPRYLSTACGAIEVVLRDPRLRVGNRRGRSSVLDMAGRRQEAADGAIVAALASDGGFADPCAGLRLLATLPRRLRHVACNRMAGLACLTVNPVWHRASMAHLVRLGDSA